MSIIVNNITKNYLYLLDLSQRIKHSTLYLPVSYEPQCIRNLMPCIMNKEFLFTIYFYSKFIT